MAARSSSPPMKAGEEVHTIPIGQTWSNDVKRKTSVMLPGIIQPSTCKIPAMKEPAIFTVFNVLCILVSLYDLVCNASVMTVYIFLCSIHDCIIIIIILIYIVFTRELCICTRCSLWPGAPLCSEPVATIEGVGHTISEDMLLEAGHPAGDRSPGFSVDFFDFFLGDSEIPMDLCIPPATTV